MKKDKSKLPQDDEDDERADTKDEPAQPQVSKDVDEIKPTRRTPHRRTTRSVFGTLGFSILNPTGSSERKKNDKESDDDAGFGFGGGRKEADEEEDNGEDQDMVLAELVDDKPMDEETLAKEKVDELHR